MRGDPWQSRKVAPLDDATREVEKEEESDCPRPAGLRKAKSCIASSVAWDSVVPVGRQRSLSASAAPSTQEVTGRLQAFWPGRILALPGLRLPSPQSLPSPAVEPNEACWRVFITRLEHLADEHIGTHPHYSSEYLEYIRTPCSVREVMLVVLMIIVVPAAVAVPPAWTPGGDMHSTSLVVEAISQFIGASCVIYGAGRILSALSEPHTFRAFFETVLGTSASLIYVVLYGLLAKHVFGVFPVPLGEISYTIVFAFLICPPLTVAFMRPEARHDPAKVQATWRAYQVLLALIVLLCNGAPLSLGALALLQNKGFAQVLALLSPWVLRKIFEAFGVWRFRDTKPEVVPVTRLIAISFYEAYLSIIAISAADFKWYVLPMAIACDLLENASYLVIIRHTAHLCRRKASHQLQDQGGSEEGELLDAGLTGLVTSVLIKEFMEVIMPLQTGIALVGMYTFNPKWNVLCAGVSPANFWYGVLVLTADVVLEAIMLIIVMQTVRRQCGLKPMSLLVRVLHHDLHTMTSMVIIGFTMNLGFQHAFHGSDLSLQFRWLQHGASWQGGLCWTFAHETPQEACRQSWHSAGKTFVDPGNLSVAH